MSADSIGQSIDSHQTPAKKMPGAFQGSIWGQQRKCLEVVSKVQRVLGGTVGGLERGCHWAVKQSSEVDREAV